MRMAVPPERVGEIAVRNTLKKRMLIVPGGLAKLSSIFIRLLPKQMIASIYDKAEKRARRKQQE